MKIAPLVLCLAALGCKAGTYNPEQAAADAKMAITIAANEVSFRLSADGKEELAAQIQADAATVKDLINSLISGEETSIGVLRQALLAVEKRVADAVVNVDPAKKDMILHEINQVHTIVAYFIDRYERQKALEIGR